MAGERIDPNALPDWKDIQNSDTAVVYQQLEQMQDVLAEGVDANKVEITELQNGTTASNKADTLKKTSDGSYNDGDHYLARENHTGTQTSDTISNFAQTVRDTVLTGLSIVTGTAITVADTVLSALGKLQKQINDILDGTKKVGKSEKLYTPYYDGDFSGDFYINRANHIGFINSSVVADFAQTVRNTVLTGLNVTLTGAITVTDSVITAFGKLQNQISNLSANKVDHAFKTIRVAGQQDVIASLKEDLLTIVAGSNITLLTDASGKILTISASGVIGTVASSVTVEDAGGYYTGNNAEAVLQEIGLTLQNLGNAVNISIADVGGYFTSTDIEGALQELGLKNQQQDTAIGLKANQTDLDTTNSRLTAVEDEFVTSEITNIIKDSPQSITTDYDTITDVQYEGLTLVNSVENGDFSNGTTGYVPTGATLSVSNGLLSVIGDGGGALPQFYKDSEIEIVENDEVYINLSFKITNSDCNRTTFVLRGSTSGAANGGILIDIFNPNINEVYTVNKSVTLSNVISGKVRIFAYHQYPDAATANGKVMEVDGNAGVFAINIKSLNDYLINTLSWTSQEVEDYMLWNARKGHFNGMKYLDSEVKSVGKNLVGYGNTTYGDVAGYGATTGIYNESTNEFILNAQYQSITRAYNTKVGESYTIQIEKGINSVGAIKFALNYNFIINIGDTYSYTFVANSEITYLSFYTASTPVSVQLINFQLEKGTVATSYEPYKESTSTVSGKRLPNQVADTESLQKVSDEYVLQSGDIDSSFDLTNNTIYFTNVFSDIKVSGSSETGTILMDNFDETQGSNSDDVNFRGYVYTTSSNGRIYFIFALGTSLVDAQNAIAGTKLIYELATPIERTPKSINVYENGQVSSNDFLPVNLNLTGIGSLRGQVDRNTDKIMEFDSYNVPNIQEQVNTNVVSIAENRLAIGVLGEFPDLPNRYGIDYTNSVDFGITEDTYQQSITADLSIGATVVTVGSTDGRKAGEKLTLQDTLNREEVTIVSVDSATQLTITATVNAYTQANGGTIYRSIDGGLVTYGADRIGAENIFTANDTDTQATNANGAIATLEGTVRLKNGNGLWGVFDGTGAGGGTPDTTGDSDFTIKLMLPPGDIVKLTGCRTQGHPSSSISIKDFELIYTLDGTNWLVAETFQHADYPSTISDHTLATPVDNVIGYGIHVTSSWDVNSAYIYELSFFDNLKSSSPVSPYDKRYTVEANNDQVVDYALDQIRHDDTATSVVQAISIEDTDVENYQNMTEVKNHLVGADRLQEFEYVKLDKRKNVVLKETWAYNTANTVPVQKFKGGGVD